MQNKTAALRAETFCDTVVFDGTCENRKSCSSSSSIPKKIYYTLSNMLYIKGYCENSMTKPNIEAHQLLTFVLGSA